MKGWEGQHRRIVGQETLVKRLEKEVKAELCFSFVRALDLGVHEGIQHRAQQEAIPDHNAKILLVLRFQLVTVSQKIAR